MTGEQAERAHLQGKDSPQLTTDELLSTVVDIDMKLMVHELDLDLDEPEEYCNMLHSDIDLFLDSNLKEECKPIIEISEKRRTPKKKEEKEVCPECHKCVSHMRKHILVHSGEKPYLCKFCSQKFSQKSNLNRHVKSKHEGICVMCKLCNKNVKRRDKLKSHMKKYHPMMINNAAA